MARFQGDVQIRDVRRTADAHSCHSDHTSVIMDRISITLPESTITRLSDTVGDEYESRSEAVRELLEKGFTHDERMSDLEREYEERMSRIREEYEGRITEYEEEIERLTERIERLETERERLQREKRQILEQREEHTELVKVVKEERSLAKRKAEAGLWTKTKWALFGMKDEE